MEAQKVVDGEENPILRRHLLHIYIHSILNDKLHVPPYSYSNLYALHYKHQIMYRVTFEKNIVFWPIRITTSE